MMQSVPASTLMRRPSGRKLVVFGSSFAPLREYRRSKAPRADQGLQSAAWQWTDQWSRWSKFTRMRIAMAGGPKRRSQARWCSCWRPPNHTLSGAPQLVRRELHQLGQGLGVVLGDHLLSRDFHEFHLWKISNLPGEEIHRCARDLKSVTPLRRALSPRAVQFFWFSGLKFFLDLPIPLKVDVATTGHRNRYEIGNSA
jgi:hypothetical protein